MAPAGLGVVAGRADGAEGAARSRRGDRAHRVDHRAGGAARGGEAAGRHDGEPLQLQAAFGRRGGEDRLDEGRLVHGVELGAGDERARRAAPDRGRWHRFSAPSTATSRSGRPRGDRPAGDPACPDGYRGLSPSRRSLDHRGASGGSIAAQTTASIRRATASDAPVLAALGRETFAETFGHLYPPEDLAGFLDAAHAPAHYTERRRRSGIRAVDRRVRRPRRRLCRGRTSA